MVGPWLRAVAPRLHEKIQNRRRRRCIAWLRLNGNDLSARFAHAKLANNIINLIVEALVPETPLFGRLPVRRDGDTHSVDVLYVGVLKPDALKDVLALKAFDPDLRCIALSNPIDHSHPAHRFFDAVLEWRSYHQLIEQIQRIEADVVLFRGSESVEGIIAALGARRFVWQVRDTWLRAPRAYVPEPYYEIGKYLAEHADAICTFHSTEGFANLRGEVDVRGTVATVHPGCVADLGPSVWLPKISESAGEIHIAYGAGIDRVGGSPNAGHADQYVKFESIVDRGIHLHAYSPHLQEWRSGWKCYFELAQRNPHFHIERTLPFPEYLNALTQYDWGLCHFSFGKTRLREGFEYHASNGFFAFVQARLPIICSTTTPGMARMVHTFGNGIVIDDHDFPNLGRVIEGFDRQDLRRRLDIAAEALAYDYRGFGRAVLGGRRAPLEVLS